MLLCSGYGSVVLSRESEIATCKNLRVILASICRFVSHILGVISSSDSSDRQCRIEYRNCISVLLYKSLLLFYEIRQTDGISFKKCVVVEKFK